MDETQAPRDDDLAPPTPVPAVAEAAAEAPEESVRRERDAVGDGPDTGGLVPPDDAQ